MDKSAHEGAFAVWITGLPASGKSTITTEVRSRLDALALHVDVLESDAVRAAFFEDLVEFLAAEIERLGIGAVAEREHAVADVLEVRLLGAERRWDQAFQVIRALGASHLLPDLLTVALDHLLHEGRTQTVVQWLDLAEVNHVSSPVIDLAAAETKPA